MTTVISGSYPAINSDSDATVNGLTVGKGGGANGFSTAVGQSALAATNTQDNAAFGFAALYSNTSGGSNSAFGSYNALYSNTTGNYNCAFGRAALQSNTTASNNTAVGYQALQANTTASNNTAIGYQAAYSNTTGTGFVAMGYQALQNNSTGGYGVAIGFQAGQANTTGNNLVAIGSVAVYKNTTGAENVGVGAASLATNTTGSNNVAIGSSALTNQTTASNNTAVGYQAGYSNTTGTRNTFLGYVSGLALTTGTDNTFIGVGAGVNATTGTRNTFIGVDSGISGGAGGAITTGSKNTIIGGYTGNNGGLDIRTASNYIVLSDGDGNPRQFINASGAAKFSSTGNFRSTTANFYEFNNSATDELIFEMTNESATRPYGFRTRFSAASPNNTTQYFYKAIDSTTDCFTIWSNGTTSGRSDERLKKNIVDASPKLNDICQLKVRNYEWKESDGGTKEIGLIAQEVEQVFPNLVVTHNLEKDGDDYKEIKYSVFVPMLIKAIQELKAEVDSLKAQLGANNG